MNTTLKKTHQCWCVLVACGLCFLSASLWADEDDPFADENHRYNFREAVTALQTGNRESFLEFSQKTQDYILYPYLQYYDLKNRISSATDDEIETYLDAYKSIPPGSLLRLKWLYTLGAAERWDKYLSIYNGERSTKLVCYKLQAKLSDAITKKSRRKLFREAEKIWMVGKEQPGACVPVLKKLESTQRITVRKLWQRIELAMGKGNYSLAKRLAKPFGKRDRSLVSAWIRVHKKPEKGLKLRRLKRNTRLNRLIVLHGIKRIANKNAERAREIWNKKRRRYSFDPETKGETSRYIALEAAYQRNNNALTWLKQLKPAQVNKNVRIWKLRTALRDGNWQEIIRGIQLLTRKEQQAYKWRYWLARGMEQTGNLKEAQTLYEELSQATNYYGFMAADRIDVDYRFDSNPIARDDVWISNLGKRPAIKRARELYLLNRVADARREWNRVIRRLKEPQVQQAALLAHDWEWHDNAIFTISRTRHRKDLALRFPTPFRDQIFLNAETYDLDPSLIYGVTRRESAFKPDARSGAGALGLMQLMPSTARYQSKLLGVARPSNTELLQSDKNIFLGSAYLNNMLQRFDGNQVLATAAYNAGPNRVARWIPEADLPADIWVDTLPYRETREYVRAVMAYSIIFNWQLDEDPVQLKSRMEIVGQLKADEAKSNI